MSVNTLKFYETTIGKKIVMALSGAVLLGFVFSHMAGNLLIFAGESALNNYALSLRQLLGGAGIWVARLVLVGLSPLMSGQRYNSPRRTGQHGNRLQADTEPSKHSGVKINGLWWGRHLLYIAYHLAHLTFGVIPGARS